MKTLAIALLMILSSQAFANNEAGANLSLFLGEKPGPFVHIPVEKMRPGTVWGGSALEDVTKIFERVRLNGPQNQPCSVLSVAYSENHLEGYTEGYFDQLSQITVLSNDLQPISFEFHGLGMDYSGIAGYDYFESRRLDLGPDLGQGILRVYSKGPRFSETALVKLTFQKPHGKETELCRSR